MAGRRVGYAAKTDYVKAGHQCSSFPGKGVEPNCYRGGPTEGVGTQEALCVPILANGTTDFRVGHDNIISLDDDPVNEGGCIFNDQTNHGLPGRREFREVRVKRGALRRASRAGGEHILRRRRQRLIAPPHREDGAERRAR